MLKDTLYHWGGANEKLFYMVNGIQGGEWYEKFMLLGSFLGNHHYFPFYLVLIAAIAVVAIMRAEGNAKTEQILGWSGVIGVLLVSYGLDGVILKGLKAYMAYPRPFQILPEGTVHLIGSSMDEDQYNRSFPSGHASFAMLLAASLWPVLNKAGNWLAAFFVVWVSLSRLALGVHFPMDVLAGAVLCLGVVMLVRHSWNQRVLPFYTQIVEARMRS